MIKTVHSLNRYEDSIDWDAQRENFIEAVRESRSQSRSADESYDTFVGLMDNSQDGEVDGEFDEAIGENELIKRIGGIRSDGGKTENIEDARDGVTEDALHGETMGFTPAIPNPYLQSSRGLQRNIVDGDVFDGYEYSRGNCPNDGSLGVPCAPINLSGLCNKYNRRRGSFRACLDACTPAFCCIHDAPPDLNTLAPNCNADENCPQYNYCYIAWWKLHDTVGPALLLRVEQDDTFFDIPAEDIEEDVSNDPLYIQVLLHHFDDIEQVITDGRDGTDEFDADRIFFDEDYWVYPVTDEVQISDFQ